MKRCAFLSMDDLGDFFSYDELLVEPLARRGWEVQTVSWRDPDADWNDYDAVVIRTPWDYHKEPDRFMEVLEQIDHSSARLENALELIRWNIDKTYLRELEQEGIQIVPTLWKNGLNEAALRESFEALNTDELVVKPTINAGAEDTFRVQRVGLNTQLTDKLHAVFSGRPLMIQPFMQSVVEEGEYSLFYFGGHYSHSILKTPVENDFRVQEEFGGRLKLVDAGEALREAGRQVMKAVAPTPL
ncbi:MAG: ATP-grasp domain-containing protein, partial [Balneolaceae bacterium]